MKKRRRWTQGILLSVALLALTAVIAVFVEYRKAATDPQRWLDLVDSKADMQLKRIRQTAMKNGVREWRLEAESATLIEAQKTVLLTAPVVVFFLDNGENIQLTADSGNIATDSSRLRVEGRVTALTGPYRFQTKALAYDPEARKLHAETAVTLSSESFSLEAQRMAVDLETNVSRFEGGVHAIIDDDLQL